MMKRSFQNSNKIYSKDSEIFSVLSFRQKNKNIGNIKDNLLTNIINHKNNSQPNLIINRNKKEEKNNYINSKNQKINNKKTINNEIINNIYSTIKNDNKNLNERIRDKNQLISNLKKELIVINEKKNKRQIKTKLINSVDIINDNKKNKIIKSKNGSNEKNKLNNRIYKKAELFFKNIILKRNTNSKENNTKKNNIIDNNLILHTTNYINYKKNYHKKSLISNNLHSDPTRESDIPEIVKNTLYNQTRKNNNKIFKSNSFHFISTNLNINKRKINDKTYQKSKSQNEIIFNKKKESINDLFSKLNHLKERTNYLLSNFLSFFEEK